MDGDEKGEYGAFFFLYSKLLVVVVMRKPERFVAGGVAREVFNSKYQYLFDVIVLLILPVRFGGVEDRVKGSVEGSVDITRRTFFVNPNIRTLSSFKHNHTSCTHISVCRRLWRGVGHF